MSTPKTLPKPAKGTAVDNKCTGTTGKEVQQDTSKCTATTGKDTGVDGLCTND
jgi:hypothetical protein